jgi:hypothetical protein
MAFLYTIRLFMAVMAQLPHIPRSGWCEVLGRLPADQYCRLKYLSTEIEVFDSTIGRYSSNTQ